MARYAKGKHAVLISDRSGWKIKYKDARTEWTGARVSKFEWEAKQPQLNANSEFSCCEISMLHHYCESYHVLVAFTTTETSQIQRNNAMPYRKNRNNAVKTRRSNCRTSAINKTLFSNR